MVHATQDGSDVLLAVVSDGAGSASHSQAGAKLTTAVFTEAAIELLRLEDDPCRWPEGAAVDIVDTIRSALERESQSLRVRLQDLACTLVAAVIGVRGAAFIQIGDGAIVTPAEDGASWAWVHWPSQGEYANTTTFVTHNTNVQSMQFDRTDRRVDEVAVFSDGLQSLVLNYADKSVHNVFFDQMMPPVRRLVQHGQDEALSSGLADYLRSELVMSRSGDDISLLLATRLPQ